MFTNYKLFKLLSRMIALAEQHLLKKLFSALRMTKITLNVWFSQTKHFFYVYEIVNKRNVRIWRSENLYEVVEKERDCRKLNVWCGLMHDQIIGQFIFSKSTITADTYLNMLKH